MIYSGASFKPPYELSSVNYILTFTRTTKLQIYLSFSLRNGLPTGLRLLAVRLRPSFLLLFRRLLLPRSRSLLRLLFLSVPTPLLDGLAGDALLLGLRARALSTPFVSVPLLSRLEDRGTE